MPEAAARVLKESTSGETASRSKASAKSELPLSHVAIIMDGNRRWATKRHLPRAIGHKHGVKSLKALVKHVGALSLPYLTVYAFSSENWQRSEEEVGYLMRLFTDVLSEEFQELADNQVKLRFIGDLAAMPEKLRASMAEAVEKTKDNSGLNLQVAINYGSRLEITQAVRKIAQAVRDGKLDANTVDDQTINQYLYTSGIPDPELLIRTGGEMRLSNYLLWQSAYTEIYVIEKLWPDFTPADFDEAVSEFTRRERRYGS